MFQFEYSQTTRLTFKLLNIAFLFFIYFLPVPCKCHVHSAKDHTIARRVINNFMIIDRKIAEWLFDTLKDNNIKSLLYYKHYLSIYIHNET